MQTASVKRSAAAAAAAGAAAAGGAKQRAAPIKGVAKVRQPLLDLRHSRLCFARCFFNLARCVLVPMQAPQRDAKPTSARPAYVISANWVPPKQYTEEQKEHRAQCEKEDAERYYRFYGCT